VSLYLTLSEAKKMNFNLSLSPTAMEPAEEKNEESLGLKALLIEMAKVFLLAVVIIIPVRIFLFQPFFVQGSSMDPNFADGQYLIVSEFGYKQVRLGGSKDGMLIMNDFRTLGRQEAIVFRYPKKPEQFFIKRLIAYPGESIEIKNNQVIIYNEENPEGFVLDESEYLLNDVTLIDMPKEKLSDESYFVMGDNRDFSYDSRFFGPVDKEFIMGRVLIRAWPFSEVSVF
jgi:signal peptidase I